MVIPRGKPLCWLLGDLSIKAHDNHRPSVVASWMGSFVIDEVLLPSDRGERSETFSLGGEGYPRGIAKGDAPLASFLPYLSRSKDRVGGSGGRSAPVKTAGPGNARPREWRRSRPQARTEETSFLLKNPPIFWYHKLTYIAPKHVDLWYSFDKRRRYP